MKKIVVLTLLIFTLAACSESPRSVHKELTKFDPSVTYSAIGEKLSLEEARSALLRIPSLNWNGANKFASDADDTFFGSSIVEDGYTYFGLDRLGQHPAVYKVVDGVDHPVSSICLGAKGVCFVKGEANKWVLRIGDRYACVQKTAQ